MHKSAIILVLLLLFITPSFASGIIEAWYPNDPQEPREADEKGVVNLSLWRSTRDIPVLITSDWEFYWNRELTFSDFESEFPPRPDEIVTVGNPWSSYREEDPYPNFGYATYRLQLDLPENEDLAVLFYNVGTAYRLFWNDKLISSMGDFGIDEETSFGKRGQTVAQIPFGETKGSLIIQISNFQHPDGGIHDDVIIGSDSQIFGVIQGYSIQNFLMFGFFVVMGFYHIFMFFFRSVDKSPLYFALICFVLSIRIMVTENNEIFQIFPGIDLEWVAALSYLTFTGLVAFFSLFITSLFSFSINRFLNYFLLGTSILYSLLIIIFPTKVFTQYLIVYQIFAIIGGAVLLSIIIAAIVRRDRSSILFGIGFLLVFIAAIIDILSTSFVINVINLTPRAIIIFVFMQALVLTRNNGYLIKEIKELNDHLTLVNESSEKFVPKAFLRHLEKKELSEIGLGDYSEMYMTVLFADIRKFTSMSEGTTPRVIFSYLNEFLSYMGPEIRRNYGFVDKYLGDGIMALFPRKPEDAINAAIDMQRTLESFNQEIKEEYSSFHRINMGIGIHSGDLILGTIGEEERMDTTVISDAVNLAARLEELSQSFQSKILISGETESHLSEESEINRRSLGSISLRRKMTKTKLFEVFDSDPEEQIQLKKESKESFEAIIAYWTAKKYQQAKKILQLLDKQNPKDGAVKYYLTLLAKAKAL
jgi:adenylate cyclase